MICALAVRRRIHNLTVFRLYRIGVQIQFFDFQIAAVDLDRRGSVEFFFSTHGRQFVNHNLSAAVHHHGAAVMCLIGNTSV